MQSPSGRSGLGLGADSCLSCRGSLHLDCIYAISQKEAMLYLRAATLFDVTRTSVAQQVCHFEKESEILNIRASSLLQHTDNLRFKTIQG